MHYFSCPANKLKDCVGINTALLIWISILDFGTAYTTLIKVTSILINKLAFSSRLIAQVLQCMHTVNGLFVVTSTI